MFLDRGEWYSVFPDLKGIRTIQTTSIEEGLLMANKMLGEHLALLELYEKPIPEPTPINCNTASIDFFKQHVLLK